MSYAAVLNKLIYKSKLQVKEIAERCVELGTQITPSYISTLRNENNTRIPAVAISETLETVLCAPKHALVVEAYLQNAPKEVTEALEYFKSSVTQMSIQFFEGANTEILETAKAALDSMTLSELLLQLNDSANYTFDINSLKNFNDIAKTSTSEFKLKDNSMEPLINKDSTVFFVVSEEHSDGDILLINHNEKTIIRKVVDEKNGYLLIPINRKYPTERVSKDSIMIIGRVTEVRYAL